MTLRDTIRENLINCRDNGHETPDGCMETVLEMIDQGALPEDVDRDLAARICGELQAPKTINLKS